MDFPRPDIDESLILSLKFLAGVSDDERLHALISGCDVQQFRSGQTIFAQGDEARYTYVVLSGQVMWMRQKPTTTLGMPILSYFVAKGELIGQYAMLLYDLPLCVHSRSR